MFTKIIDVILSLIDLGAELSKRLPKKIKLNRTKNVKEHKNLSDIYKNEGDK